MNNYKGKFDSAGGKITEQLCEEALARVCDAYLFHLTAMHRRPVYRHQNGDIALNQPGLHGFIDSYLAKRWSVRKRMGMYVRMLDIKALTEEKDGYFLNFGNIPTLRPRAIGWLNAMLDTFGRLALEHDPFQDNHESGTGDTATRK